MPKAASLQSGFNTGEVSPLFYGATDNPRYKKAVDTMQNFLPFMQGPATRRPGTKYAGANVKDSTKPGYLIPFRFSNTQNYQLEFGDGYVRFWTNNAQMITVGTTYKLTGTLSAGGTASYQQAFPFYATRESTGAEANEYITGTSTVVAGSTLELQSPYAYADLPLLRWTQSGNVLYLFHPKYPPFRLARETQQAWKLSRVYLKDGPYLPANSYATPGDFSWATLLFGDTSYPLSAVGSVNVATINGAANNGLGAIRLSTAAAHGLKDGQKIFISGVTGTVEANNYSQSNSRPVTGAAQPVYWAVSVVDATHIDLVGSTFTNAWVSGGTIAPAVFWQSAQDLKDAHGTATFFTYPARDIGRSIAIQSPSTISTSSPHYRYWGHIVAVYDAASIQVMMGDVTGIARPAGVASIATDQFFLGVYSGNSWQGSGAGYNDGLGYPATGGFHQNRLWMAGAANSPQQVDSSITGAYESFSLSDLNTLNVAASNACSFVLNSTDSNPIRWLESTAQGLLAATAAGEWALTPSSQGEALSPLNFNAMQTSFFGSSTVKPVRISNAVLYIQNALRKLREMTYFFYAGTFRSSDLSEISEHITIPSLNQLVLQKEPQPLVWGVRGDGALTTLLYNRDDVSLSAGWARQILGGVGDALGNPPKVLSASVIPDPTGAFDQLWLVVQRYINGATVCTVEYLTKIPDDSLAQADSFCLDCGATYVSGGAPVTTVTGLTWLKGETVGVLTDGGIHPDVVVDNTGAITLQYPATKVQIGYRYKSRLRTLRDPAGAADGTSIGKTRRVSRVAVQLHNAGDLAMGWDWTDLVPVVFAQADQNQAGVAVPLFSGIIREGLGAPYDFDGQVCLEMSSPLPGTIQGITTFFEEFDI